MRRSAASDDSAPHRERIYNSKSKVANVLSFSTEKNSSSSKDGPSSAEFKSPRLRMIKLLVKKYPLGLLWTFDESGRVLQVEDGPLSLHDRSPDEASSGSEIDTTEDLSREREFEAITSCFPGVRQVSGLLFPFLEKTYILSQVLYAPIFDPATSLCICACFAVSLREVPVFTTDIEVAYTRSFLNNVAVEWDRVTVSKHLETASSLL